MKILKVKYALLLVLPIILFFGLNYFLNSENNVDNETCSRETEILQTVKNIPGVIDADIDSANSEGCSIFFMINSNSVSFAHDLNSKPFKINTYLFNEDVSLTHNLNEEHEEFSVARKTKRGRNHLLITDKIYFENSISIKEGLGIYIEEVLLN